MSYLANLYLGESVLQEDPYKAIEIYKRLSSQKQCLLSKYVACLALGNIYLNGDFIPRNYQKAYKFYSIILANCDKTKFGRLYGLAEKRDAYLLNSLNRKQASILKKDLNFNMRDLYAKYVIAARIALTKKENKLYLSNLKKAADLGDLNSAFWLANCYSFEGRTKLAIIYYTMAADALLGNSIELPKSRFIYPNEDDPLIISPIAMYKLGRLFSSQSDYKDAVLWYKRALENGCKKAAAELSLIYKKGSGSVKPNVELAEKYKNIADHRLDSYYEANLLKTKGDIPQARKIYLFLAENGNVFAQRVLGLGRMLAPTPSYSWTEKAAKQGDLLSMTKIGVFYANKKDYNHALPYFKTGAVNGVLGAKLNLAFLYENGSAVKQDLPRAMSLYKEVIDNDLYMKNPVLTLAYLRLGGLLLRGTDQKQEGIKYLTIAAGDNNTAAMTSLGTLYEKGWFGIKQDLKKAKKWYLLGAKAGNEACVESLRHACFNLPKKSKNKINGKEDKTEDLLQKKI